MTANSATTTNRTATLCAGPDLRLTSATSPRAAKVGALFELSWTVDNIGSESAGNGDFGWSDYIWLSTDAIWDPNQDLLVRSDAFGSTSLPPGAS
jgi:hypothetical protein